MKPLVVAGAAAVLAVGVIALAVGRDSTPKQQSHPHPQALVGVPTGDVSKVCGPDVSTCWTCKGPVALDRLSVIVDSPADNVLPVKLSAGCTGAINEIEVITNSADGVKVSEGAHDLTIGSGSISCNGRFNDVVHRDGIQAMGGDTITFRNVGVFCPPTTPSPGDLDHSCFFVNRQKPTVLKPDPQVPHAIVFENGYCASSGETVDIATSDASGVRDSTICPSVAVPDAFFVPSTPSGGGPPGTNVVNEDNTFLASC